MGRGLTVKGASSGVVGFGGHKKLFVGERVQRVPPPIPLPKILMQWSALLFSYHNF